MQFNKTIFPQNVKVFFSQRWKMLVGALKCCLITKAVYSDKVKQIPKEWSLSSHTEDEMYKTWLHFSNYHLTAPTWDCGKYRAIVI